jgi:hypothetical protein
MNEPIDHHYLSIFYLSRWVGDDGRLCRFSRPYGPEVKWKRITPKGTGFEPGLYAMGGVPPDKAQAHADEMALSIARKLMNHEKIGKSFNNMQWHVIDIPEDCEALLTSDRPVWMSASLAEEEAFLTIPIGPRKLFTATVLPGTQLEAGQERARRWREPDYGSTCCKIRLWCR